jgi:hypothetical protein
LRIPRGKKRRGSGYIVIVVLLGLALFAVLFTILNWVASQQVLPATSGSAAYSSYYDPTMDGAMNQLWFPGLATAVCFGALIEVINVSSKKSATEDYI